MKRRRNRLLSIFSAAAMLLVSLLAAVPVTAAAGEEPQPVEIFTDVNGFNIWGNPYWWNYTITQNPWKFVRGTNDGQTELRYDTNRYGSGAPITIDLRKTPFIEYDLTMSGNFSLHLCVDGAGEIQVTAGTGRGSYDLRSNQAVMAAAKDGVITVSTLKIQFAGSADGSELTVNALRAVAAQPMDIFTHSNGFNVWGNHYSLNYSVTENPWKLIRGANDSQTELRYDTNRYGNGAPLVIDLNKTPILEFDLVMTGKFEIYFCVNGGGDIKVVSGTRKGTYDLRKNAAIMAAADHGVITVPTLKIQFVGSAHGSELTVKTLRLVPAPYEAVQGDPLLTGTGGFHIWNNPYQWNYTITENPWKFVRGGNNEMTELRYDTNRVGAPIAVDLQVAPIIDFDIEMDGNYDVRITIDDMGELTLLTGTGRGTFDLSCIPGIQAAAKNGIVTISTVKFAFNGSAQDSSITVNTLQAVRLPSELSGHSITLADTVGVNFMVKRGTLVGPDDYMQFTAPNSPAPVKAAVKDAKTDSNGYLVFSCPMAAKEMTDTIKAELVVGGKTVLTDTYSVEEYAGAILAPDSTFDAKTKEAVRSMLNYGAAAQAYFNYHTDRPANGSLSAADKSPKATANAFAANGYRAPDGAVSGLTYYASSLNLESATGLFHYFKATDDAKLSDYRFTLVGDGETVLQPELRRGMFAVEIRDINASGLDKEYTLRVTKGEETLTLVYSPYTYANLTDSSKPVLAELMLAMADYCHAANACLA